MESDGQTVPRAELEVQVVLTPADLWANQMHRLRGEPFLVRYFGSRVLGGLVLFFVPFSLLLPPWTVEAKVVEIGIQATLWMFLISFGRWAARRQFSARCSKPEAAGMLGEKTLSFASDGVWCMDFEGEYFLPWASAKVATTHEHIFFTRLPMAVILPRRFLNQGSEAKIESLLEQADRSPAPDPLRTPPEDATWVSHSFSAADAQETAVREVTKSVSDMGTLCRWSFLIGAGGGSLLFWMGGGFDWWLIPCMAIGTLATAVVWPFITRALTWDWRKKAAETILQEGPKEIAVGLSPDRLLVRRDDLVERYRWGAIDRISVEPDRLSLWLPSGSEITMPVRAFRDDQSLIDFETTARAFHAAARGSAA